MKKYIYRIDNEKNISDNVSRPYLADCYCPCMSPCPFPCYHPGQRFSTRQSKNFFRLEPFGSLESINTDEEILILRDQEETKQYLKSLERKSSISKDELIKPSSELSLSNLVIPYYVRLEFTYRCNLSCTYCYSASSSFRSETMPFPVYKSLIDMLKKERLYGIQVLGGEPFLYPEYIYYLLSNCKFPHIVISTNGTLINDDICSNINNLNPYVTINIGIDSHDPAIHNKLRGGFSKILDSIEILNHNKIRIESSVCITKYNVEQLESLVNFLIEKNFQAVQFIPVGMSHLPKGIGEKLSFENSEYLNGYLYNIYQKYSNLISMSFLFPVPFIDRNSQNNDQLISFGPCDGGILSACIGPDNTMSVCPAAPTAPHVPIVNGDLSGAWLSLKKKLFSNGKNIKDMGSALFISQQCKHYGYGQSISESDIEFRNNLA